MIVLDVNVVLALARPDQTRHAVATSWLRNLAHSENPVFGVPNLVWHALVRIASNRRAVEYPSTFEALLAFADELRRYPAYRVAEPGPRHLTLLREVCEQSEARGNLITDAAIAAIAIENGAGVASFDRDFARFRGLRWSIPGDDEG